MVVMSCRQLQALTLTTSVQKAAGYYTAQAVSNTVTGLRSTQFVPENMTIIIIIIILSGKP